MKYAVNPELLQSIVNYLQRRPYNEVAGLITEMMNLEPADEAQKDVSEEA